MKTKYLLTTVVLLSLLVVSHPLAAFQTSEPPNVNSRYTVEDVQLRGVSESKISEELRKDILKMVGEKFDQHIADAIAERLRDELRDYSVELKVRRGDKPEHVKIFYKAERRWFRKFDFRPSQVVYQSKEGRSAALSATIDSHHNAFTVGWLDNADELLERNTGLLLGYEHRKIGTDRLRLRMRFESTHQEFNPATELALQASPDIPGIYRARQDFAPSISVLASRNLELSAGVSFQRLQIQYPEIHTDTAYAATFSTSYGRRFESSSSLKQEVSVDYGLRSATRALDSDFVYTRHTLEAGYRAAWGKNQVRAGALAGRITGTAPLFERFSLGNSRTLRGWNKFDVAPLGGNRLAYASLEYRYSIWQIFYDAGSVWDPGGAIKFKNSVGFGIAEKHSTHESGWFLLVGVPLRMNDVSPILAAGIRF